MFVRRAYMINFGLFIIALLLYMAEVFAYAFIVGIMAQASGKPQPCSEMTTMLVLQQVSEWLTTIA